MESSGQFFGRRGSAQVLIIEDNTDHAELILKAFRYTCQPVDVRVFSSGLRALHFLHLCTSLISSYTLSSRPDFILLDLKLPGMDGFEILQTLKSDPLLKDIPVAILTTSNSPGDRENAARLGADDYLVKPCGIVDLSFQLRRLVDQWLCRELGDLSPVKNL